MKSLLRGSLTCLLVATCPMPLRAETKPADLAGKLLGATMAADLARVRECLTNGAPVNEKFGPGLTAWQVAEIRGVGEIENLLAANGADTNVPFPPPAEILDWALPRRARPDGPGFSLAVVQDGRTVYKGGWGMANLEDRVPIGPNTIFHVASVSKQFTAFGAALLAEEGKLSLEDDVRKYVPRVPDFGKTITLRHLCNHTSGLRDQWELWMMRGRRMEDVITQEDLLRLIERQRELNFPPGDEHLYCNAGFTVLAEAVGKASGRSFTDFTRERIFAPLGMARTHFHLDEDEIVPGVAYSYATRGEGFRKCLLNYGNVGATSLYTTAEDLARWLANLMDPKVGGSNVVARMRERARLNNGNEIGYGLGLSLGEYRGAQAVQHGGADAGFRSYLLWIPERRWGVAVLGNSANLDAGEIAFRVADVYLRGVLRPADPSEVKRPPAPALSSPDRSLWAEYLGTYRLAANWWLTFTREGDRLMVQASRESRFPTIPLSNTKFFVEAYGSPVEFQAGADGHVKELVYRGIHAPKLALAKPSPAELTAYAGDYWSEELGMLCSVGVRDGRLASSSPAGEWYGLNPTEKDRFDSEAGALFEFTRDAAGKIDGFKVTSGRVRHLRFRSVSFR